MLLKLFLSLLYPQHLTCGSYTLQATDMANYFLRIIFSGYLKGENKKKGYKNFIQIVQDIYTENYKTYRNREKLKKI